MALSSASPAPHAALSALTGTAIEKSSVCVNNLLVTTDFLLDLIALFLSLREELSVEVG
ncbi:Hypothetical protein CAP_5980 [Chondromyces apiculatus DSM 436]|uniref:Uncharacterized protein n=1 Tax=Chondromyces apiculatus DSM 436 TaxID=1192034 RepID=A0A017TG49_9BACT|nr:Hypothetical protein CAP_5980 [Chondromyces apiculatus DSM 436]